MNQKDPFFLSDNWQIHFLQTKSGPRLRYATYVPVSNGPASDKPAAKDGDWVILLNGRTEWIEKYSYVAEWLGSKGYRTLAVDHRGQGLSGGARAHAHSYRDYGQDLIEILADAGISNGSFHVLAHSMGGLIALHACLCQGVKPKSIAMSSPLLLLPNQPVPRLIASPLTWLIRRLGLGRLPSGAGAHDKPPFDGNDLTHDRDRYERMRLNPFPVPSPTMGWVRATFDAIEAVHNRVWLSHLNFPVLILGAEEEAVTDPDGIGNWAAAAQSQAGQKAKIQVRSIAGAKHELLSEIPSIYEESMQHFADFFSKNR